MDYIRRPLRRMFDLLELILATVFPSHWNPLLNLGALGFFFYWIITVTGIYVYIFLDTGVHQAFASVEYMTNEQWFHAGIMRSLHRYASDALIVVILLHLMREFSHDRYRGVRWFNWVTGVPVLVFIFVAGITGYWLVWDKLAQYVALVTTEWLDKLPIFGEPIARNFLSPASLDDRFFTLMIFMHIAVPLIALVIMWIHLQRVTKPRINPPRGLAIGVFVSMLALSLVYPAVSQGPADLAKVPGTLGLDWFYLPLFPLMETLPGTVSWSAAVVLLFAFLAVPWLPPMRKPPVAVVNLDNCNGCARCRLDCPYNAITMRPRSDGKPFVSEATVNSTFCVSCGICVGSCPTAMPFRRARDLIAGIDLPDRPVAQLREEVRSVTADLKGKSRVLIVGCDHGVPLTNFDQERFAMLKLRCIGQLPPSFIDFVLSRDLVDGVMLTGCTENGCHARFGPKWTTERIAGARDPHLRARVPRDRLRVVWAGRLGRGKIDEELRTFSEALAEMAREEKPHLVRREQRQLETVHD